MAEEGTTNGAAMRKKSKRATAKKTAPKKSSTAKAKFDGSKTDFIRQHANLKPLQVEAKAKELGLDIPAGYVSSVRSKSKTEKKTGAAKGTRGARAASARGGAEADFRRAARGITLDRAQQILDEIRAAYEG